MTRCFDKKSIVSKSTATPADELDSYMVLDTRTEETNNVLLLWKEHAESLPMPASILRDLFSIPAANTAVQRLFFIIEEHNHRQKNKYG